MLIIYINKMSKMNKMTPHSLSSNPIFLFLMFIVLLIIFLAIFRSVSPFLSVGLGVQAHVGDLKGSFRVEAFENQMSGPVFVIFYAPWCGHCKRTMPEFEKLQQSFKGQVKLVSINADLEENKELVQSQKVQGFPTIRYFPSGMSGKFDEYNGERTAEAFEQYLGQASLSSGVSGVPDIAPDRAAPV
jgi:protein disulfide-isomerase-like protein